MAMFASGFFSFVTGDLAAARSSFEAMRLVCEQTGIERERAYAVCGLGIIHGTLGEIEPAIELLTQASDAVARVDDPVAHAYGLYYLASALATARRLAEARQLANEGLDASKRGGDTMTYGALNALLGTLDWQLGDSAAGESRLREAVRAQHLLGHRWGLLTSLEGLAWVAGSTEQCERAALLLGASAALSRELGVSPLFPYWDVHRKVCEETARATLGDAGYRRCWERGYAMSWDEVTAAVLEESTAVDRPAPAVPDAPAAIELSARELEVARLAASGMSNRAIADKLFVSVATVKSHVSHVLTKLGLDSRVQLAGWVAEHDRGTRTPAG
jgi:non-specific serine/threonine protein kinase